MEKQRKFLLVLPLLVTPFLTMAFWALGGGKSGTPVAISQGLSTDLPQAQFNKQSDAKDKLALYQHARKDSSSDGISPDFIKSVAVQDKMDTPASSADDQALQIQRKLARLNEKLNQPDERALPGDDDEPEPAHVKRLHQMMRRMNSEDRPDPEMRQLNKMLDKLQAIQNPEAYNRKPSVTEKAKPFRAIPAIIDGKQKVADGAAVKLKLTDTSTIKGQLLPKDQEIYGSCQIINQRLLLNIENIRCGKQIIPISLTVFSLDGMPGIPAPEAELTGTAGNGANSAVQSMQLLSMDGSLGTQAAIGGVNAAKELFNKKVKKIKVKLKDAYPVLLKINR